MNLRQSTSEDLVSFSLVSMSDGALFRGLAGVGGFLPMSALSEKIRQSIKQDPVTLTFGPDGAFGIAYYPGSTPSSEPSHESQIIWWSTYEVTPAPTRDLLLADLRAQLLERHGSWKSPYDSPESDVFSSIISLACGSENEKTERAVDKNILILPQYVPQRLPRWSSETGKVILLGDAAHPVPPESGQGVSCATEDGLALALLLKHYLIQQLASKGSGKLDTAEVLNRTKTAYEDIRMKRIARILCIYTPFNNAKARTWFQERVRDWVLWMMCKLDIACALY